MNGLRPFLLILMASLFAFSGMARASPLQASASPPPCHEAPAQPAGHHDTSKATLALSCCIACIAAPQALPQPLGGGIAPTRASYETAAADLRGRPLPPEPRPPRA